MYIIYTRGVVEEKDGKCFRVNFDIYIFVCTLKILKRDIVTTHIRHLLFFFCLRTDRLPSCLPSGMPIWKPVSFIIRFYGHWWRTNCFSSSVEVASVSAGCSFRMKRKKKNKQFVQRLALVLLAHFHLTKFRSRYSTRLLLYRRDTIFPPISFFFFKS